MRKKHTRKVVCVACICSSIFMASAAAAEIAEFQLEPVNVTAMGYQQKNLSTAADVQVYTADELAKTGASDVANALKFIPGVYYSSMGPHDQNWITGNTQINLRGITNGTLVLINGVPASFGGVSHLDMVSLEQVERVEVVKGGGAILYGSDAYGGVINVITKSEYNNTIKAAYGNKGQREYDLSMRAGKANFSIGRSEFGSTGIMTQDSYSTTLNVNPASNTVKENVAAGVSFGDSTKDHFGFTYNFDDNLKLDFMQNKKEYSLDYVDKSGQRGVIKHFDYDIRDTFAQLAYNKDGFDTKLFYSVMKIDNPDWFINNASVVEWEKSTQKNYGIDSKKVWELKDAKVLLGVGVKRETYEDINQKYTSSSWVSSPLKPVTKLGEYGRNEYSLYTQWDQQLNKASNFIVSLRQDSIRGDERSHFDEFLPQFQFITRLSDTSSVYVNAGKSFRMPTYRSLYYSSSMIVANPDLQPEHGWNYEVGYKHENKDDSWRAVLFKVDLKDQLTSETVSPGVTRPINASGFKNEGLELSYTKKLVEGLSYTLGGIWSDPQQRAKNGEPWKKTQGRYQVMTGINYQNKDTSAALNVSYWGDRIKTSNQTDVRPLVISNLHIGHKLAANARANFTVNNIFDRKDLVNGDSDYLSMGRTYRLGISYDF